MKKTLLLVWVLAVLSVSVQAYGFYADVTEPVTEIEYGTGDIVYMSVCDAGDHDVAIIIRDSEVDDEGYLIDADEKREVFETACAGDSNE